MEEPSRSDDFTVSHQDNDSAFASLGRNVAVEFLSGNYVKQLVACCCGEDEGAVFSKEAEKSAGNDRGRRTPLTIVFVSTTTRSAAFIDHALELPQREASATSLVADNSQGCSKFGYRFAAGSTFRQARDLYSDTHAHHALLLLRERSEPHRCFGAYSDSRQHFIFMIPVYGILAYSLA